MAPSLPPVRLSAVAGAVEGASIRGDGAAFVTGAVIDSRRVTPGAIFFCVPGERTDGHAYAAEAMAGGAGALVVERWLDVELPQVRVPAMREALGPMSALVFGRPAESIRILGITGTNGKTTTTYLLESVLAAAGLPSGVVGTIGARIDGELHALAHTTPEAPDLHRLLAEMRAAGVSTVAMEVSSHALAQHRADGIVFDVVVFTNLSQDHLDYHRSMEEYFRAKSRLFTAAMARRGVVNVDDEHGRRLLDSGIPLVTVAIDRDADLRARDVSATPDGLSFRAGELDVRSSLRGRFNVLNCLACIAAARLLGIDDAAIARGIAELPGVPGRVEPVLAGQDFLVVVDYAHTPDSIRTVLRAARPLASGRLIVVFGCGGDRDRAKRPLMGAAATENADLAIVTTDNPRSEDPLDIIAEIEPGAKAGGGVYVVEPDRRAAIALAVGSAKPGDVVVIAGKGHEPYQELADRSVPFDDRDVARQELSSLIGDPT